jgi:carboxylesterase type B
MNLSTAVLAAAMALPLMTVGTCPNPHPPYHDLRVKTTSGTFTGFIDPKLPKVRQWLGVPFGAPPVGEKRFLPAESAPYSGSKDAKAYKPICLQNGGPGAGIFWELVPEFQNTDEQDEDCLYLNIWAPEKPKKKGKGDRGPELIDRIQYR